MNNAKRVQILQGARDLVSNSLHVFFAQLEVTFLNVLEHVLPREILKHYIIVIAALEVVIESDDVSVLAHLEHNDLSSLLKDLYLLHVLFLDNFDSHFPPRLLVHT